MMAKRAMMIGLDGADPLVIKRLIDQGRLPNLKWVLENGVRHEDMAMLGAFPSVTPPNWASIATGCWPRTHGVTCFFNHTLGKSLGLAETNWDSGRVQAELIWETFSKHHKRSIQLNYCEAWPPRLEEDAYGVFIDGTGVVPFMRSQCDFQKLVTLEEGDFPLEFIPHREEASIGDCVVSGEQYDQMVQENKQLKETETAAAGVDFTAIPSIDFPFPVESREEALYVESKKEEAADKIHAALKEAVNWQWELGQGAKEATLILNNGTVRRYAVLSASDGVHYDTLSLYANKKTPRALATVQAGQWSSWVYDEYLIGDKMQEVAYKLRVVEIAKDGRSALFFMTHTTNLADDSYFYPHELNQALYQAVGPMTPMAKFRRYEPLGERAQLPAGQIAHETFEQLMQWHAEATHFLFDQYPDWALFYTHLHGIDLYGHWYINHALPESDEQWAYYQEMIYKMYELNDRYIGEMLSYLDGDTSLFITSDHGIIPESVGDYNPNIGSLSGIATGVMEELGYTKTYRPDKGPLMIDWSKTRAVFQRTSYVYINLKGRDPEGIVEPEAYEQLVEEIIAALYSYRHPDTGKRVVSFCMNRQEMEMVGMGGPHCGDILVQLMPTYCLEHANCPSTVGNEGYSLNNLCLMAGAGFKQGAVIKRVIRVTDIVPTICYLTNTPMSSNVEGGIIYQALADFEEMYCG